MKLNQAKRKKWAWILLFLICFNIIPTSTFALTGGPSQPEVETFQPIEVTDMVDPATGDFSYNIPLMEVGGYPINLIYNAGITMDQEASNVGLGWNINPGVITRSVRGIPDDFNGDKIEKESDLKDDYTFGISGSKPDIELFGINLKSKFIKNFSAGLNYNNYNGIGFEFNVISAFGLMSKVGLALNAELGLSASTTNGLGLSPSLSFDYKKTFKDRREISTQGQVGTSINTRNGLRDLSWSVHSPLKSSIKSLKYVKNPKISLGSEISFSTQSYSPQINSNMLNLGFTFSVKLGEEFQGSFISNGQLSGYVSRQGMLDKKQSVSSFGYLYSELGKSFDGIQDFNRHMDGVFSVDKPCLPLTILTNDIYSISGQGISGSYQFQRGDIGIVNDKKGQSFSSNTSLGFEAGAGVVFRLGGDIHSIYSQSYSGKWDFNNSDDLKPDIFNNMDFQTNSLNNPNFENVALKAAGELSPFDNIEENLLSQIGGKEAVKIVLDGSESTVRATSNLKANFGNNTSVASPLKRDKRTKRNQNLSFLLVPEAMHAGLDKSIKSYPVKASPADPILNITIISRAERGKPFHISEFTALRPDGLRYVYGIPAYNVKQVETSFAVDNESYSADCGSGLIKYDTEDGRPKHKFGSDHYLSRDETPPYAYCYLLTAILSEDYVDLTSDGPSSDDLGTYTKINYSRLYADYKWRVPYTDANFSEGLLANKEDDKGNYLYGEKDIWIIQSIESKTQKAEFYYSDRRDGHGVRNESGGQDAVRHLKKLDRITLYSLPDLMSNSPNSRTPIKSVYFNYIYSLCPNVSTNDGIAESNNSNMNKGKLTLISLHFTYGLSEKGKFSPYKFEYNGINPTYSLKSYNRWGTYQPMNHNTNSDHIDDCVDVHKRITTMIPYIPQLKKDNINTEEENADKNSSAWSLTDIQLPSGSKISISYEADDYAYIQNKEAMQMIEITGTSKHSNGLMSSGIELDLFDGLEPYRYIYFDLYHEFTGSCSASQIRDSIQSYYIRDLSLGKDMLFKVFASLDFTSRYDFVQGYTKIDDWGAIKDGSLNYNKGFIRLALKCTKDKEWPDVSGNCNGIFNLPANPISKAIWQCARLNYPKLVSGNLGNQSIGPLEITDNEDDVYNIAEALLAAFDGFADLILGGTNNKLLIEGYGKKIMKGKSWLRLYNPNWKKLAGTHRVSKVVISDEWDDMTNGSASASMYGQEYDYTTNYSLDKDTIQISSGVAAYEPIIGGEENTLKQAVQWKEEYLLAPDNSHYLEKPIGEPFYPAPTIIYSEVKVRNLQYLNVNKKASGWTKFEFYTAKDFPVIEKITTLSQIPKKTNPILEILKVYNKNYVTASQGYSIIVNDMHGKEKSKSIFNQNGTLISSIKYFYKINSIGELSNEVQLLYPSGNLKTGTMGFQYSMIGDQRESKTKIHSAGCNINNDNITIPPLLPIAPFLTVFPFYSMEDTKFRSIVLTKHIQQTGILDYTISYDLGSTVETRNLVWDGITGEVLATQTFNEFEDPIYNFSYPAHWAYKGMGPAYKNINAVFKASTINSNNEITISSNDFFQEGDEVLLNGDTKAWVKTKVSNDKIILINFNGAPITDQPTSIKIIRSGHRNKASTSIGAIVSLENPVGTSLVVNGNKKIINASAIEFDDKRNMHCCMPIETVQCSCTISDYKEHKYPSTIPESILNDFFNNLNFNNISANYAPMPVDVQGAFQSWMAFNRSKLDCMDTSYCAIWDWRNSEYRSINETDSDGNLYHTLYVRKSGSLCECKIQISVSSFNVYKIKVNQWGADKSCSNCRAKVIAANYYLDGTIINEYNEIKSTCFKFFKDCKDCCDPDLDNPPPGVYAFGNVFNPYTTNHLGTFTPKRSYTFLALRKSTTLNTISPDLKNDGYFTNTAGNPYFSSFWQKTMGTNLWVPNKNNWTWTAEVTKIHPNGNELESKDPLDRYSCEMLGYNDQMVIAVAGNSRYGQSAFEGFEDYHYTLGQSSAANQCPVPRYFSFLDIRSKITKTASKAHSGKYFLSLSPADMAQSSFDLYVCTNSQTSGNGSSEEDHTQNGFIQMPDTAISRKPCDCLNQFNPIPGKYIFSAWVNESRDPLIHQFDKSKAMIRLGGTNYEFKAKGPIIEGWQKIYGEFVIPPGQNKIKIFLIASPDNWTYFDDIRIHPFDASFKSFVYDDITLRFTYELDENNYFTKYEYDDSGKLERVKKETEKGVMTIQETRFSNKKIH